MKTKLGKRAGYKGKTNFLLQLLLSKVTLDVIEKGLNRLEFDASMNESDVYIDDVRAAQSELKNARKYATNVEADHLQRQIDAMTIIKELHSDAHAYRFNSDNIEFETNGFYNGTNINRIHLYGDNRNKIFQIAVR